MPRKFFLIPFFLVVGACAGPGAYAPHPPDTLQLRVEPAAFSPNADGVEDQTFFSPVLKIPQEASRWKIDIRRTGGKHVTRLSGGGLPTLIPWDGTDIKKIVVPEGPYTAVLTVWTKGPRLTAQGQALVDVTPPVAQISVSTPSAGSPIVFTPRADDAGGIARWQLQILSVEGRTAALFWSTGNVREVQWDGRDRLTGLLVPPGNYRCAFQVWDIAGNEGQTAFTDLTMTVTPREMLEEALHHIKVYETDIGLIVQLKSSDLFRENSSSVQVTTKGKNLLQETAVLINAYPGVPVTINGYAIKKRREKGRDHSSLYAWSVYSYLVKQGGVTASRLNVQGRGKRISADRKGVDVPPVTRGVEVVLVGNREW